MTGLHAEKIQPWLAWSESASLVREEKTVMKWKRGPSMVDLHGCKKMSDIVFL